MVATYEETKNPPHSNLSVKDELLVSIIEQNMGSLLKIAIVTGFVE